MSPFGNLCIAAALGLALFGAAFSVAGARTENQRLILAGQRAVYAVWALTAAASFALVYMFLVHDFTNEYVWKHSDTTMPVHYLITAWWGGMDGSMLFWAFWLTTFSAGAVFVNRHRYRQILPYATATLMVVAGFFMVLLLFEVNPFRTFLVRVPTEGEGLNPLLQNPTMVIHPPNLYLGFVGLTVPFAFAMGALISGKLDGGWIKAIRRWTVLAWMFLSCGNLLGGWWAYTELGWGGFWAWDPVENAAFMPWLTATAFLHSIMITERRGMLKVWNMVLVVLSFVLTLVGTSLTRSGVVSSVHAFAQSSIGHYFWLFTGGVLLAGIGLIVWRLPLLRSENRLDSMLSREFAFLLNNAVFLVAAVVVLFGTLTPLISELVTGHKIEVGPPAFNRFMAPIGLAIMALMGIGPLIAWRKATPSALLRTFAIPLSTGALTVGILLAWGVVDWFPLTSFGLCAFVMATVTMEYWRGVRVRMLNTGENPFVALANLVGRARRRYGGYLIHVAIVMLFLGITGAGYSREKEFTLPVGGSYAFYGYELKLAALEEIVDPDKWVSVARVEVTSGGKPVATLNPARFVYRVKPDMPTTEVAVRSTLTDDLYLVLGNYDPGKRFANLKAYMNPLVAWMWIGGAMLVFGAIVAVWPELATRRVRVAARSPAVQGGGGAGGAGGAGGGGEDRDPLPAGAAARAGATMMWIVAALAGGAVLAFGLGGRAFAGTAAAVGVDGSKGLIHEDPTAPGMAPPAEAGLGRVRPSAPADAKIDPLQSTVERTVFCSCGCRHVLGDCGAECGPGPSLRAMIRADLVAGMTIEQAIERYLAREGPTFRAVPKNEGYGAALYAAPYVAGGGALLLVVTVTGIWVRRGRARGAAAVRPAGAAATAASGAADLAYQQRLRDELRDLG